MMVTNDEINAERLGVSYLLMRLDTAVEDDDKLHSCLVSMIDRLLTYAITFIVSVWDIILYVGIKLAQELIYQCDGRASIDIVVTKHHDTLLASHRIIQPIDCHVHILHEEWIDEIGQLWTEESLCSRFGSDSTLYQKATQHGSDAEFLAQLARLTHQCRRRIIQKPFVLHGAVGGFGLIFYILKLLSKMEYINKQKRMILSQRLVSILLCLITSSLFPDIQESEWRFLLTASSSY